MSIEILIKYIKAYLDNEMYKYEACYLNKEDLEVILKALEQQPKKGHWIKTGDYYTGAYECLDYFECSCCHEESLEEGDYCPNCGAKMEVGE